MCFCLCFFVVFLFFFILFSLFVRFRTEPGFSLKHSAASLPSASERLSHKRILVRGAMTKRIFSDAVGKISQHPPGPGSASLDAMHKSLKGHMAYGGSRQEAVRWEYSKGAGAGFAELHKDHIPTGEDFFQMLQQVPGVTHVEWNTSKTSQGNPSDSHYMERNIFVTSSLGPGSASHPFEFELTRHRHMKDTRLPFTVSACFKEPSPDMVPEAWRILTEVIKGKEFAPLHVAQYRAKVLERWENKELSSQHKDEDAKEKSKSIEPPGSASGPDVLPHPSIEPPGSASGPDVLPHPDSAVPFFFLGPELPEEQPVSSGGSLHAAVEMSDGSQQEVGEPVPDSSNASLELPDEETKHGGVQDVADWEDSLHVEADADGLDPADVEMSSDFRQEVEKPVSDSSDASLEQALLWRDARQEILPSFLQPKAQMWTAESPAFQAMQAMKTRELEHVRWRAARPVAYDPEVQCVEHSMRTDARKEIQTRVDLAELSGTPGSASVDPVTFLKARHKESLQVTDLKKATPEGAKLREQYCELFKRFPHSTVLKVGEDQLRTDLGKAQAVTQLVSKHSGEIVEIDRTKMGWILHPLAPGSASVEWSKQWNCKEDGGMAMSKDSEYGFPTAQDLTIKMHEQADRVLKETRLDATSLVPNWAAQTRRTVVSCVGTDAYEWRRTGQVVTLGTLFMVLGKKWSALSIYYFYRTLRIVATKRQKNAVLDAAAPGSASARVGITGTDLQPTRLRSELRTNKTQLVKEYALVMNLGEVDETSEKFFQDAVRYLQVCLLSDLRPPWADYNFPQALPGDGTLSRYTRPCFLQWEEADAAILFGDEVMSKLCKVAADVSHTVVGVLGRPLYVCTARPHEKTPERLCMATASMSPLMQLSQARKHYLCAKCKNEQKAPVSDSAPLRVLHLYVTVAATDGLPTPVRMKPLPVVLEAPPDTFAWHSSKMHTFDQPASMAVPTRLDIALDRHGARVVAYAFNPEESKEIWCSAGAFRGEAPVAP